MIGSGVPVLIHNQTLRQTTNGSGRVAILRLDLDGEFSVVDDSLTTPIDLAFDVDGRLYVLEFVDGAESEHPYKEKTGRLLRFNWLADQMGEEQVLVEIAQVIMENRAGTMVTARINSFCNDAQIKGRTHAWHGL